MSIGGKGIIVVGGTGMGKTTFNKKYLELVPRQNIWLYDVNAEYKEFLPENYTLPTFQRFCEHAAKLTQSVIVFEEATIFLSNRGCNEILVDILVRKRHTENTIFLVFHSLRRVPKYLLDLCNLIVLHKTNDPLSIVEVFDNDDLTSAYSEIKNASMLTGSTGKQYSPSKHIKLMQ